MIVHGPGRGYAAALGWTVLGTFLPGLGLIIAGRRRTGGLILGSSVALAGVVGWLVATRLRELLHVLVNTATLRIAVPVLILIGVAWVMVVVASYRALRPPRTSVGGRIGGSVLVGLLAAVVMVPFVFTARLATVQSDLVDTLFKPSDQIKSETKPENVTPQDPWGGQDRLNILLVGSDGGKGRAEELGERTDTVMVASIDTDTGDTSLFSLPRNLLRVPFPEGSKLDEVYPKGFGPEYDMTTLAEQNEYMLTSLYQNVPQEHPDLLESDDPGADALKLGVGAALDLQIHYYVMVNLGGFEELVEALGGITVNINYPVPKGGIEGVEAPDSYLQPGPNQHLNGEDALWFARGRYGLGDYSRMERQRCFVRAVINQAEPANVLQRYESLANASKDIVRTDIPGDLLAPMVDLSLDVKDASFDSFVFSDPFIDPAYPDYELIQATVQETIAEAGETDSDGGTDPTADPTATSEPTPTPTPTSDSDSDEPEDPCAYHPDD